MKIASKMAFTALGAGAVLAYQKYQKPMMKKMDKMVSKALKSTNHKLEEMM